MPFSELQVSVDAGKALAAMKTLRRRLHPDVANRKIEVINRRAARVAVAALKQNVPVRTGNLRRSMRVMKFRSRRKRDRDLVTSVIHAGPKAYRRRADKRVARRARRLGVAVADGYYGAIVNSGVAGRFAPRRYFQRAMRSVRPRINAQLARDMIRLVEREVRTSRR